MVASVEDAPGLITPHTAFLRECVASPLEVFAANLKRYLAGQPLEGALIEERDTELNRPGRICGSSCSSSRLHGIPRTGRFHAGSPRSRCRWRDRHSRQYSARTVPRASLLWAWPVPYTWARRAPHIVWGLAGIAMVIVALFRAGGAGAGVAQPLEGKVGAMAVVPLDVHSGTGGDVYFDRFGIDHGHMDKYIQS